VGTGFGRGHGVTAVGVAEPGHGRAGARVSGAPKCRTRFGRNQSLRVP
jgi:hypothetical protein